MKRLGLAMIMVAAAVAAGLLAGCAGSGTASEEHTAADVGEHIRQAVDLDDMLQGDVEKLQKLYRIEAEKVEDFVLFTASSNVKADELAVIKVKDANEVDVILDNIRQRIDAQSAKFQDYRPEEYALVAKHVLKTKGRLILFAVSDEAARIEAAFDEALK